MLGALLILGPVSTQAAEHQHGNDIVISGDRQLDRAHGVRSGRGTVRDPYVISGWNVFRISIKDTSKAVRIVDNTVTLMQLNWMGRNVLVRGNDIQSLFVNENTARRGAPTSGVIERNTIARVDQIRHFDGMFVRNVVGTRDQQSIPLFSNGPAVNFDGFNGAHFAYNTIYGYMDARLHGHHHSSQWGTGSHMHSGHADHMVDHTRRFHEVWIHHNRIVSEDNDHYALQYTDTGHAGNDRTAASETNKDLNKPHIHYTKVHITDNVLEGAGIYVDTFNAADELHRKIARGVVDIARNRITLRHSETSRYFNALTGINVWSSRGMTMKLDRNTVSGVAPRWSEEPLHAWDTQGTGIKLFSVDAAGITITGTRLTNLAYGIEAASMSKTVYWTIERLSTSNVSNPVVYDSSVANRPTRR